MSDGHVVLSSDTSNRIDIIPMIAKNWEAAEKNKVILEEL